ncbi:MAG: hypothetical protein LBK95_21395 [Bifidobacteriaceae bacterium]|nr:hypothetical protein [Bifidobacteriaceae bacterium]
MAVAEGVVGSLIDTANNLIGGPDVNTTVVDMHVHDAGSGGASGNPGSLRLAAAAGAAGLVAAAFIVLLAYARRPVVMSRDTVAAITDLPVLAVFGKREESPRRALQLARVTLEKLALANGVERVGLLCLICADSQDAPVFARSAGAKALAEALGPDTLILSGSGRSGHEVISQWEDLARIGPYLAHIVLSPALQDDGRGAKTLAELAKWRSVILVSEVTPLSLAVARYASATLPGALIGRTAKNDLALALTDLDQAHVRPAGLIVSEAR